MSIFEDKKIKHMSKNTVAVLTVVFIILTGIMSYFVWKNPRDFEAWFITGGSLFLLLYCGWQLILKWDS
jgi:hypothetical protein